ncbi:AraC-type DNA-binding protein [Filimonas lacunae]|uniref:AraC-type DNA-binding protein n=2 Tax=Filimonas lacunae TaxID=477680 RepID=A0A1N7L1S1_9BACT|nr:AraC-type DNA-binding protein [Filimonas lacunae]
MNNQLLYTAGKPSYSPEQENAFDIQLLDEPACVHLLKGERKRLTRYEIICFTTAAGLIAIDVDTHIISDNFIYCLVPGQIRRIQTNGNAKGYYISFSEEFLYRAGIYKRGTGALHPYSAIMSTSIIVADAAIQSEIAFITTIMKNEYNSYNLLRSEILSGLLYILSAYFSRKLTGRKETMPTSKDGELVQRFMYLLKSNFTSMKQVSDFASELCVSPNYLNRAVKKITGSTASAQIQRLIVMEAKKQAIHSNNSMKEIAYMLGFTDIAHFSKFFKNNSGVSFTHFRKEILS